MRDGVISNLAFDVLSQQWVCDAVAGDWIKNGKAIRTESKISALDAFMQMYARLATLKLEGREIYSPGAKARRAKLGL